VGTLVTNVQERLLIQGGRMTGQRRLICESLEAYSGHPTAEEVYELVRPSDPSLNLSTVYRTLRWLEQEGLVSVRRFDTEGRRERFDPVHPSQHHHFLCSECKCVIEFDTPLIDKVSIEFETEYRAAVNSASLELYGLCKDCQEKQSES